MEVTDMSWLLAHLPDATDDDLEYFLERVGMRVPDFFTIEHLEQARREAFDELRVKHKQV